MASVNAAVKARANKSKATQTQKLGLRRELPFTQSWLKIRITAIIMTSFKKKSENLGMVSKRYLD